jgi:hypothetical protein
MTSKEPNNDFKKQPELGDLISLNQAAQLSGLSTSHLRLLVTKRDLWGIKLGRNWFTTTQAIQQYQQAEHKTGPKTKKQ